MTKDQTIKIFALSFVPFIMVLGNSMLIPVLADIKRELQISQLEANLIISYFFLGSVGDSIFGICF